MRFALLVLTCCAPVQFATAESRQLPRNWDLNVSQSPINIVSEWASNKCLDLPGGNTKNGNLLWIWSCNGMTNQQWVFGAGTWRIQYAGDPEKCVDALGWGGGEGAGTRLGIWDCNGGNSQKWGYDSKLKTVYLAASESNANLCMDTPSQDSGSKVHIWNCDSYTNQAWDIRAVGPSGSKAGVALHMEHSSQADRNVVAGSGIRWYYNWATGGPTQQGLDFMPMIWGSGSLNSCSNVQKSWALLGFNEPNMDSSKGGSAMSVDQVVQLWPQVEKCAQEKGVQTLIGPAVANVNPSQWYDAFFSKCQGCRVDAIAIHSYSCDTTGMKNYINTFKKYGKPLWLTEFACADNPAGIPGNAGGSKAWNWQCQYMKNIIPFLMGEAAVAKFAWFSLNSGYTGESNLVSGGQLTQLGACYNSLVGGALNEAVLV